MNAESGIVTLADSHYFPGLLMLHRSVQESFPCEVACYDLGLTPEQRAYAERMPNLRLLPLPGDPLIARMERAMSRTPALAKPNKRIWPLWICPLLIRDAPFRNVFWMDCDLVVLRGLPDLFVLLNRGPFFTPENKAPHLTPNKPELYHLLPIERHFDPLVPTVNAGVSGWRKDRDRSALDAYLFPVEQAIDNLEVRAAVSWHDQGALIWAIQSLGLERFVAPTTTWNLCVDYTPLAAQPLPWDDNFLAEARAAVPEANILHWNGRQPPWL